MGAFSEIRSRSRSRSRGAEDDGPQYEISDMKVEHIIEMVAGLLTKITTTNDQQHEHLHRQPAHLEQASHLTQQTSSVLAFHGKNVPSITILSYLSRINKYCPTSYEVFLSLLVYFDRMTERVNAAPMQTLKEANEKAFESNRSASSSTESLSSSDRMQGVTATTPQGTQTATPPASGGLEKPIEQGVPGTPHSRPRTSESPSIPPEPSIDPYNLSHFFVVDSFNIHRLVIAGVTCASKFFSDIFYTNSRYAKVSAAITK
jgi:PHO85 cyclin-6/7